jgi:hypothetical protein
VEGYEVWGDGERVGSGNGGTGTASKYRVESSLSACPVVFGIVSELECKCRRERRRGLSRNDGLLYTCVGQGIGVGGGAIAERRLSGHQRRQQ